MNNKLYDALKYIAQVVLPAAGTMYYTAAQIWGLPGGDKVVGTIVAVDTFLGVVLHISSKQYNNSDAKYDGAVTVTPEEDSVHFQMDPEAVASKDELRLKVKVVSPTLQKVKRARKSPK